MRALHETHEYRLIGGGGKRRRGIGPSNGLELSGANRIETDRASMPLGCGASLNVVQDAGITEYLEPQIRTLSYSRIGH